MHDTRVEFTFSHSPALNMNPLTSFTISENVPPSYNIAKPCTEVQFPGSFLWNSMPSFNKWSSKVAQLTTSTGKNNTNHVVHHNTTFCFGYVIHLWLVFIIPTKYWVGFRNGLRVGYPTRTPILNCIQWSLSTRCTSVVPTGSAGVNWRVTPSPGAGLAFHANPVTLYPWTVSRNHSRPVRKFTNWRELIKRSESMTTSLSSCFCGEQTLTFSTWLALAHYVKWLYHKAEKSSMTKPEE